MHTEIVTTEEPRTSGTAGSQGGSGQISQTMAREWENIRKEVLLSISWLWHTLPGYE